MKKIFEISKLEERIAPSGCQGVGEIVSGFTTFGPQTVGLFKSGVGSANDADFRVSDVIESLRTCE